MANIVVAYLCWVFGGIFGLHHFYLGRDKHAFVWWMSSGGFGLGCFRDLWRLPEYVYASNRDSRFLNEFADRRRRLPKPPFSIARFTGSLLIGNLLTYLFRLAIPEMVLDEITIGPILKVMMPLLGSALGVYLVYSIGHQKTSLKACLIGSCIGIPWLLMETQSLVLGPLAASFVAHKYSAWNPSINQRKGLFNFIRRVSILSLAGFIYLSMWTSVIYFNVHVTTNEGEHVPIYEAVNNFFRSPAWKEMKKTLSDLYTFCQTNGWGTCYAYFIEQMDPTGESSAYKTLDLERGASKEEITAACRKLSRKWHPDKYKKEEEKMAAQERFIEIQSACDTLNTLRQRRTAQNMKSDTSTARSTTSKPKYAKQRTDL